MQNAKCKMPQHGETEKFREAQRRQILTEAKAGNEEREKLENPRLLPRPPSGINTVPDRPRPAFST
jgi:hypothetical protein